MQKLVRAGFGNNNVDTCARVCHSPDRLRAQADPGRVGRHAELRLGDAGRCDFRDRREPHRWASGVRLADEAPPAPGGAADRRRSAPHRSGAHAAYRRRPSLEAQARHQRRAHQQPGACGGHRGAGEGAVRARALRCGLLRRVARVHRAAAAFSGGDGGGHRRAGGERARRGAAVCHRRQRRDLLRPGGDRAQPGLDHGDGHRESGDGHRQPRPRGRGRQPAARPEQRAGLLRHGLLPARIPRLPPCLE